MLGLVTAPSFFFSVDDNQCIVPTSVILTSTSIASLSADVDLSSVQSQSITQAVSSFLPAPSVEPEIPGIIQIVYCGLINEGTQFCNTPKSCSAAVHTFGHSQLSLV